MKITEITCDLCAEKEIEANTQLFKDWRKVTIQIPGTRVKKEYDLCPKCLLKIFGKGIFENSESQGTMTNKLGDLIQDIISDEVSDAINGMN